MAVNSVLDEIKALANRELAKHHAGFFKTGRGEYAEGDLFYGVKVPDIRKIAKKYFKTAALSELEELIRNPYHEVRLAAVIMLVMKYQKVAEAEQEAVFNLYIANIQHINNWDLVDVSSPHIVGVHLFNKNTDKIWDLAASNHLWSERISVLASFYFIKKGEYSLTLELCRYFLNHKHDLIHKATGWMLREAGKQDINTLYTFLDEHHKSMPRTMLRYAIEKLSQEKRAFYMKK